MNINDATLDFIHQHRTEDVRTLALRSQRDADIDLTFALQQIDGWQRARTKLPMWAAHDGIIYPPHISMEQCSSEQTARYKAELLRGIKVTKFIDFTGGFGVDFSYMSQMAEEAVYVEQQEHLCHIAEHNFNALGLTNTTVVNANSEDYLNSLPSRKETGETVCFYLDPARRDTNGKKTYAIGDCTPDVVRLLPVLKDKADVIIIKLSPMLDHHEALRLLPGTSEIHIVSVKNECKELVIKIGKTRATPQAPPAPPEGGLKVICVNDDLVFETVLATTSKTIKPTPPPGGHGGDWSWLGGILLLPNSSIMKAGCFDAVSERFGARQLDRDSHIFIAKNTDSIVNFPGKSFIIHAICSMNKKEIKQALAGITHANIAVRNFPLSAAELRKRLKLKDGGDWYIFGTSVDKQHKLYVCKKS